MDVKDKIAELAEKITGDKDLMTKFKADPLGTVKALVGDKLTPEQISSIVEAIKTKVDLEKASELLGGLFGKK